MGHVTLTRLIYASLCIAGLFWPIAVQVLGVWILFILIFGKPKKVSNARQK